MFDKYPHNIRQQEYGACQLSDKIMICHYTYILFFMNFRYGGIYLDSDIVMLKPLSELNNTVGYEDGLSGKTLNGAVMVFRKHRFCFYVFKFSSRSCSLCILVSTVICNISISYISILCIKLEQRN